MRLRSVMDRCYKPSPVITSYRSVFANPLVNDVSFQNPLQYEKFSESEFGFQTMYSRKNNSYKSYSTVFTTLEEQKKLA